MSECYCCGGKDGKHVGPCVPVKWCRHGKYEDTCPYCKEFSSLQATIERLTRELQLVDEALARRAVMDGQPDRFHKVALACDTVAVMERKLHAAESRLAQIESALGDVVNERDTELDMMRCKFAPETPENAAWHDGVVEAWKRFRIVKDRARAALTPPEKP